MITYDDKTAETIKSGAQLLIQNCNSNEDVIFKASYIVSSDLICKGKVTALFDLVVFGDVKAEEIDVKGRFVCLNRCVVSGAIVVQNDMWCEDIQATSIICHDKIVAQSIDADSILADGNIIIGKTLAIMEKAQTNQKVICGETAYGAGKIIASSILTAEPLDLDDGEEALESPFQYNQTGKYNRNTEKNKDSDKYVKSNDFSGYISFLLKNAKESDQWRLKKYLLVLKAVEMAFPSSISEFRDVAVLIWLIEITQSDYFKGWDRVTKWTEAVLCHFKNIAEGKAIGTAQGKPAEKLRKGYTVSHKKYGIGVVEEIVSSGFGNSTDKIATVNFTQFGKKKFPIPNSLVYFLVLNEGVTSSSEDKNSQMTCSINDYEEWLLALYTIDENKGRLGESLHNAIFALLVEKIGLKAKFVKDRFKEKGWN